MKFNKINSIMEDYGSIDSIFRQIAEKDAELAGIFEGMIRDVIHANEGNSDSRESIWSKKRIEDIGNQISRHGNINVIPGSPGNSCQAYCVCFALDKWQASKGFRGIAQSTIEHWLSCFKINRGTLIFSSAWDNDDFIGKYKKSFDNYTNDPQHTVAVILISAQGISLQYLNR